MATTSINIQPIKGGSEQHNKREKELDYIRPELSHLNESWEADSIANRLATIKENYKKSTGQNMQKKATPIREGVVVIQKGTTMQQLQEFARKAEERFGIKAIQIHMHKDEGYKNGKTWKPNLHAHIVFDWTMPNGKSCKLSRQDMVELQTMCAVSLRMERGKSSDRKHLDAIQYKNEAETKRIQILSEEARKVEAKKNVKEAVFKASEKFKDFIGMTTNDREKEALKNQNKGLEEENARLKRDKKKLEESLDRQKSATSRERTDKELLSQNRDLWKERYYNALNDIKSIIQEIQPLLQHIKPEYIEGLIKSMPKTFEQINYINREREREMNESRGNRFRP
uniref:Mobilization protein n=1 Tax=uncultured prokaryote TaxID=198431 RepID=A0A0H5Q6P8_9ZZZZ|nr:hypothetical protein [uncultured prokaryote]